MSHSTSQSLLSIYLHIPFCTTKCTYCAFNTYTNLEQLMPAFVQALRREVEIVATNSPIRQVGTIYFGGGTPSLLTAHQFSSILRPIQSHFDIIDDAEITTEVNPNDITADYAAALRQTGINRISMGMQSANQSELDLFARRHDADTVFLAFDHLRQGGFDNISLDLIYGFPHQTLCSWEHTLQAVMGLKPEHVSLYALGLEEGTPMDTWVRRGKLPVPDDDLAADMYEMATQQLGNVGLEQYEISNWSRAGYASRHNLQYWRNLSYVGLGPGAHGFAGGVRYATIMSPQRYIRSMEKEIGEHQFPHTPATDTAEVVDRAQEIAETLMMSLRLTREGVVLTDFRQRFGVDLLDLHGKTIMRFVEQGLLEIENNRVRLTTEGRLLSNIVFRELI